MSVADFGRVLVVVPTYNEAENLEPLLGRLRAAVPEADVLVVDDGSPDGTGAIADRLAAADPAVHVMHRSEKAGLGAADVAGFRWALADGYDAVVDYLDRMHAGTVEIIRGLSPAELARQCATPAGTPITTWKWLRAMVEHEIHHRAHVYMMLQMLRVPTPPIYGLTSEEVYARSVQE